MTALHITPLTAAWLQEQARQQSIARDNRAIQELLDLTDQANRFRGRMESLEAAFDQDIAISTAILEKDNENPYG